MSALDLIGLNRVVAPRGALPQLADILDPTAPPRTDELVLDVDRLVLDAASARQFVSEHGIDGVPAAVAAIVRERGKLVNPVTRSGGIACGTVSDVGGDHPLAGRLGRGTRVATLVSLTLVPLALDDVGGFDAATHQLAVRGRAVLPPAAAVAELPEDIEEPTALAALDVAGAPSQVTALAAGVPTMFVLGAGAAGLLSIAAARRVIPSARIVVADRSARACAAAAATGLADDVLEADATDAATTARRVAGALGGPAALTVAVADAPGCEPACYLSTRSDGTILFFSMATSFAAAALGAEGIGSNVRMLIGNGFTSDRGELALDLLRENPHLLDALRVRGGAGRP